VSAREAYRRRVEHNTLTKGGIENGAGLRVRDPFSDSRPTAAAEASDQAALDLLLHLAIMHAATSNFGQ
jgi:hypothetical protein